jgi:hypothetical protein
MLLRPGPYRALWEAKVEEIKPGEVSQAGVCRVLAEYLWDEGLQPDTRSDLPRVLKDPVSRAFRGLTLSPKLLRVIISAFEFSEGEADHIWSLYRGETSPMAIVGALPPPSDVASYRTPGFDILKLQEHHWLGPHGLPTRHRTEINIRSRVDGLQSYKYRIDTPHGKVRAVRGGRQGELHEDAGAWAVDLVFPHPLRRGEMHYMEFWTLLSYDEPPPPVARRATYACIENLDLRVQFHWSRLPRKVWWAEWEGYFGPDDDLINRELVELDEEFAVSRYLEAVERAVVGFVWDW